MINIVSIIYTWYSNIQQPFNILGAQCFGQFHMYMSNGQLSLQTKYTLFIKQAGFAIASIYSNIGADIMRNTIGNKMKNKGEEKK